MAAAFCCTEERGLLPASLRCLHQLVSNRIFRGVELAWRERAGEDGGASRGGREHGKASRGVGLGVDSTGREHEKSQRLGQVRLDVASRTGRAGDGHEIGQSARRDDETRPGMAGRHVQDSAWEGWGSRQGPGRRGANSGWLVGMARAGGS